MSEQRPNVNTDSSLRGIASDGAQQKELLAALKRLSSAALARDATMGDPCRLIEVRAELAAANRQAMAAIAAAA